MKRLIATCLAFLAVPLLAVPSLGASPAAAATKPDTTITLVTHDAFAVSKPVLAAFTAKTGVKVKVLKSGDAGAALNQMILTKDNPVGDVFFGVDNTFLGRALDEGVFETYDALGLATVAPAYQLDATHHLTPIDHGDVCINYDKRWFTKHGVAVPATLDDLTKPAYKGKLVMENPATSSPGLAFLLATIARYGNDGWQDYWTKLHANDVKVVDDWTTAYEGNFTQGGNQGTYPLVVSYASSPPAAVYYSKPQPKASPVGTMLDSCFQQVEFAGVLAGTKHQAAARQLVDFMLSSQFQEDIPLQMFVFPVVSGTKLPPVFEKFAEVAPNPLTLPPATIQKNRDQWIEQWTRAVLR
ncbi:MAG: thiamine ABC transporter substrate-binding protein [Acidimicrobiia bacterium]